MNSTTTNETVNTNNNNQYTGERVPMVNVEMIKTTKAIQKALSRIDTRVTWIKNRESVLIEMFNSDNPVKKREAHDEAVKLSESIPSLKEKKTALEKKLPKIQEQEMTDLESLNLPEFDI